MRLPITITHLRERLTDAREDGLTERIVTLGIDFVNPKTSIQKDDCLK